MTGFNVLAKTPWGQCLYNRHDTTIGKCLAEHGEFSEDELELLRVVIPAGAAVLDVGANIGTIAVPLAMHVGPGGAVIAVEPQRLLFQMLCANAALNSVKNLYPVRAAAGETSGEVAIVPLDPDAPNSSGSLPMDCAPRPNSERVAMLTVDSLMLEHLHLIKIDVEGMEARVLEGTRATIARHRPLIYLENDRVEKSAALIALLEDLGYAAFWHFPRLLRAPNREKLVSINMLCFPREKPHANDLEPVLGPADAFAAAWERMKLRAA